MRGWEDHRPFLFRRSSSFLHIYRILISLLALVGFLLLVWGPPFVEDCARKGHCGGPFSKDIPKVVPSRRTRHGAQHADSNETGQLQKQNNVSNHLGFDVATVPLIHAAVSFNDSVLLIFRGVIERVQQPSHQVKCSFALGVVRTPVISFEDGFARCEHPPNAFQKTVVGRPVSLEIDGHALPSSDALYGKVMWKKVVYSWVPLDSEGDVLLFVKGVSRSKRSVRPDGLRCLFGDATTTEVVAFCQENVRCRLPPSSIVDNVTGKKITVVLQDKMIPSVVKFYLNESLSPTKTVGANINSSVVPGSFYLCACTLVWNAAKFLKEWVIYHSHLGIQKFFIYDNNSDDDIKSVMEELRAYNVNWEPWPWIKTQEASFSHCAIKAYSECLWLAFIDVDEFIFPKAYLPQGKDEINRKPALHAMIKHYDATSKEGPLGQIKISNFNFGPSGLTVLPKSGQMLNYVCRMKMPKRVKSIVKKSSTDLAYCSRVHHFDLKPGFASLQASRNDAVIHHYKYQVWEDFKMKFIKRAATFVADWRQNKDLDSIDRTPGLGTEAIEPSDWASQFCEVQDTALREYVLNCSQLKLGGKLLWE